MKNHTHLSLLALAFVFTAHTHTIAPAAAAGVFLGRVTARYPRVVAFGTGAMAYPFIKAFVATDDETNPLDFGDRLHKAYDDLAETGKFISKTRPVVWGIGVYYTYLEKFEELRAQREAEKEAAATQDEDSSNENAENDAQEDAETEDNASPVPSASEALESTLK